MGSFTGHMISGGLLIVFGLWHVFNVFLAYFRAMRSGKRFQSRACWPAPCTPNSLFPFEAVFKLGLVLLWGTIEFLVITWDSKHLYGQQGQHGSMEYLIASTGIVDFLEYMNRNNRWPWLPKKSNYAYTAFIFLLEKYILANHHPDKTGMHMNIEVNNLLLRWIYVGSNLVPITPLPLPPFITIRLVYTFVFPGVDAYVSCGYCLCRCCDDCC